MTPPGALHGVRVLDLADAPGVYCGKLLADMGADVIKIEPPGGVAMRSIEPFHGGLPHPDRSLFFWHYNTNKRGIVLDLEAHTDRVRFLDLATTADIVIDTAAPGSLQRLGLDHAALASRNPRLTQVSITPFGQCGPYLNYRGSDLVGQAMGGMVYVNGFPNEAPLQGLGLQAYHCASTYGAIGALLALLARATTGVGQQIDVSVQECVAASLEHASSFFHLNGTIAERQGSLHWTRSFRVARCRDGYVLHGVLGDWTSLLEWIKAEGKAEDLVDPAWEDFTHRRDHCGHLFDVLDAWARDHDVAALVDGAQLRRLPYAAVLPLEGLRDHPQLIARHFFVAVEHEELKEAITYPGAPYVFSTTPWRLRRRAPRVGEHTAEVLQELSTKRISQPTAPQSAPPIGIPTSLPLAGVRVIDFTWVVAGPVATRILADHGAEVIKVERRDALDFGSRRGGLTGNLNRGKHSIVIDMSAPRGVELARQLIAGADVVADNFSARVMHNWGLDYDGMRRLRPDIIALNMSGFGHTGPQRDYVSYGPTLQALCGYTLSMRHGDQPAGWGFSYSDMAAGYSGALAVLMALWHRRRTGEGQCIDLSQFENLAALVGPELLAVLAGQPGGGSERALSNRSQEGPAAPHGVYRCADLLGLGPARDRWCAIAVFGEQDWIRFCRAIGDPPWTRDAPFRTLADRLAHRALLDAHVEAWTQARSAEEVMAALQCAGVPAGVVADAEDLCRRDPHLQAREYWAVLATPEADTVAFDGVPLKMSRTPGTVRWPGPLLGEHTDVVLGRVLGMSPEAIAELRAARVVA